MESIHLDAERYREGEELYRKALAEYELASTHYAEAKAQGVDSARLEPQYEELTTLKSKLDEQWAALAKLRRELAAARDTAIRNGALAG
jgi:hypothetical protein